MKRWHSSSLHFPLWVSLWVAFLLAGSVYIARGLLFSSGDLISEIPLGEKEHAKSISQEKIGVRKDLFRPPHEGGRVARLSCDRALLQIDYSRKSSGAITERMEGVNCSVQQELFVDRQGTDRQLLTVWSADQAILDYDTISCSVTNLQLLYGEAPGHTLPEAGDTTPLERVSRLKADKAELLLFEALPQQKEAL